jgi:hypothetical protein
MDFRGHLLVAFLVYGLEASHLDQRLAPLANAKVSGGWLACAVLLTGLFTWIAVRAQPRPELQLDTPYELVLDLVGLAAKQPLPGAIAVTLDAGCDGLARVLGNWVHWSFDEDRAPPVGISSNGSSWSCRIGRDARSLTFTTGGSFCHEAVSVLKYLAAVVDLLSVHTSTQGECHPDLVHDDLKR